MKYYPCVSSHYIISFIYWINNMWSSVFVYRGCCEILLNKRKLFLQWLPENRKKAAQTKKHNKLRLRRKRVSPLLVQYDFWTKLPEESWQSNIASVVAALLFEAVEITCNPWILCTFNFLFSFLVHGWKWPRKRQGIGLKKLAINYVREEEDSTDAKLHLKPKRV